MLDMYVIIVGPMKRIVFLILIILIITHWITMALANNRNTICYNCLLCLRIHSIGQILKDARETLTSVIGHHVFHKGSEINQLIIRERGG